MKQRKKEKEVRKGKIKETQGLDEKEKTEKILKVNEQNGKKKEKENKRKRGDGRK